MSWLDNIQCWCGENSLADDFVAKSRITIVSINIMWSFLLLGIADQWQKVDKPLVGSIIRGQKNKLSQ